MPKKEEIRMFSGMYFKKGMCIGLIVGGAIATGAIFACDKCKRKEIKRFADKAYRTVKRKVSEMY